MGQEERGAAEKAAKVEITSRRWVGGAMHLKPNDGRKVVVAVEEDEDGAHTKLRLDGELLDSDDEDADFSDVYAPVGLPIDVLMAIRWEVFDQYLRDEGHRDEARRVDDMRRFANRVSR